MADISSTQFQRRHYLDAVRAFAMLSGIAFHAALSFTGRYWFVQDLKPNVAFAWFCAALHGFRMPLFMLVSGYFTMMLWRQRGLKALLRQRCIRVLIPCLIGLVTVIPAMHWAADRATELEARQDAQLRRGALVNADTAATSNVVPAADTDPPITIRDKYSAFLASDRWSIRWSSQHDPVGLFNTDIFAHLWFLWFLCWYVAMFAVVATLAGRFGKVSVPHWLVMSRFRWLWLVPITMIPQVLMGTAIVCPGFGPDVSSGWIPQPHVLLYYGIFFAFGAIYFDCDDRDGRLGSWWYVTIPLALLVFMPLGLTFKRTVPSGLAQVLYAWAMVFGVIGLFRKFLTKESRVIRYVSDSAYWLYLAHLPLVILAQAWLRGWDFPSAIRWLVICAGVTSFLLMTYQLFVRHTPIGWLLNGPRKRFVPAPRLTAMESDATRTGAQTALPIPELV
jgi:peptidoglycan/LPS O-acetylase OafA/YrhL